MSRRSSTTSLLALVLLLMAALVWLSETSDRDRRNRAILNPYPVTTIVFEAPGLQNISLHSPFHERPQARK